MEFFPRSYILLGTAERFPPLSLERMGKAALAQLWHLHSPPSAEMLSCARPAEHDLHFTQPLTVKDNNYLDHNCNSNNLTRDIAQNILGRALSIKVTSSVTVATHARSAALLSFAILGGDKYTFMTFQMLVYKVSFIIHAP